MYTYARHDGICVVLTVKVGYRFPAFAPTHACWVSAC